MQYTRNLNFKTDRGPLPGLRWPPLIALFALSLICAQADITGTVTLTGKPNSQDETFVAKANGCGESPVRHTENWKVGAKGELGDVVVWIVDPKVKTVDPAIPVNVTIPALPLSEVEIKQIGCRYIPHVAAVQAGVNFKVIDGDPTLHNVRAKHYDGPGTPPGQDIPGFNFGQVRQGQVNEKQIDDAGIYTLQCDVHGWMQCWLMVLKDDCFGVTDLDGKVTLRQSGTLADGDYTIKAWHPRFAQMLEQVIHVKDGTAHAEFAFDGNKSF